MEESGINHLYTRNFTKSRFTENFIRVNGLDKGAFKKWVFRPGMEFRSYEKWWGDFGNRDSEHEGMDLCLYKDGQGNFHQLNEKTRVPAMYSGIVSGFIKDFLGETVILVHEGFRDGGNQLCTLYAHTVRRSGMVKGEGVEEGDVIATVAGPRHLISGISPHLHISAAWITRGISYEKMDWVTMGKRTDVLLIDPLTLILR